VFGYVIALQIYINVQVYTIFKSKSF
jgi:hypothetical protein